MTDAASQMAALGDATKNGQATKSENLNPANAGGVTSTRKRIPLSVPRRKLEVDPIPGYVLYWFLDTDVLQAREAGYDFVDSSEVQLNQLNVANPSDSSGNTDLGSRVTVMGNKVGEHGRPDHLVLMKIREEWWQEDRAQLDNANAAILQAIFRGHEVMGAEKVNPADRAQTYVKSAVFDAGKAQPRGGLLNRGLPKRK